MIKELKYNGISANPTDYEVLDGDLATAIGVIPEDGSLKPIMQPAVLLNLAKGEVVKYIHEPNGYKNYIIYNPDLGTWRVNSISPEGGATSLVVQFPFEEAYQITSIGNTLVVLAPDGMHYYLWNLKKAPLASSFTYTYLGTHLPECHISFGLQGEMKQTGTFTINFDAISEDDIYKEFSDDNKTKITSQVLAKVNKFIAEESTDKGKFLYPFFVRYAYRLYDDTLTMHSAPILMIASSDLAPQVFWDIIEEEKENNGYSKATLRVVGVLHQLDYAVISQDSITQLDNWKDMIRSIDIFVSAPIYTYDQNGLCLRFSDSADYDSYCVCKQTSFGIRFPEETWPVRYQKQPFGQMYALTFWDSNNPWKYPSGRLILPRKSEDQVKEDIRSTAQFYMLQSIKIEQLTTERTTIEVKEDFLQSLEAREAMTDDYDSHDRLIPQYAYNYNSRLNITNLRKELYHDLNPASQFNFTDGYVEHDSSLAGGVNLGGKGSCITYFFIKQDEKEIVVKSEDFLFGYKTPFLFLYYPNINAYKAVIEYSTGYNQREIRELPLEQHAFLNGAFYFEGWENPTREATIPTETTDKTISLPNKIYTSEVNNPFHFPLLGINTVGAGTILGISSAAKALSEGQFGQFPLYAFTTEGVWALELSATGTYSARQPIARDVCVNPKSITQLDSTVLFATDRGIMIISGSQTQCITDTFNTTEPFSLVDLPRHEGIITLYNSKAQEYEQITAEGITMMPFLNFVKECRIIYDYTHQRIIVYNPNVEYAYIYSLKSQAWGMIRSHIIDNVNAYPEALAMSATDPEEPKLVDFSKQATNQATTIIVTRPFKMDDPDTHKTIQSIIQRGRFQRHDIQQILYGSNNLYHWHPIGSSTDQYLRGFRGTPYKYFRLAIIATLRDTENLFGATIQYTPRLTNKPR